MGQRRMVVFGAVAVAIGYLYAIGCGALTANINGSSTTGSGTTDSSGTGTAVTVSGTLTMPGTSASASLSKSLGAKVMEDVAAAGLEGTLYDAVSGDEVGTFTTDSAGAYTVVCELEEHPEADSNASADDAVLTAQLALEATNEDGSVHIETFVEVTVDPENADDPVTINADSDTTIAAQALRSQFGIATWGEANPTAFVQGDPFCFFRLQHEVFTNADTAGDGMADDLGAMKTMLEGAMASGDVQPAALGYANWGALMQATLDGNLPAADADGDGVADVLDTLATAAAGATGNSADGFLNNYADGLGAMAILGTAFGDNMANGNAAAANLAKGLHKTAADGGESACDTITGSGDDAASYLDVLVGSVVECEVEDGNCDEAYADSEGLAVMIATLDEFHAAGDWTNAAKLPVVLNSMLVTNGTTSGFNNFFAADGTIDPVMIDGFHAVANAFDPDLNTSQLKEWGSAMIQTVQTQGFDAIMGDNGVVNDDYVEYLGGYFTTVLTTSSGSEDFGGADNVDYANTGTFLQTQFNALGDEATVFGDCFATTGDYMGCQGGSGALTIYAADGTMGSITPTAGGYGTSYLSCYDENANVATCNTIFGSSGSSSSGGGLDGNSSSSGGGNYSDASAFDGSSSSSSSSSGGAYNTSSSSSGGDMAEYCFNNPDAEICQSSASSLSSSSGGSSSSSSSGGDWSSSSFASSSSSSSSGGFDESSAFSNSSSSSSSGGFGSSSSSSSGESSSLSSSGGSSSSSSGGGGEPFAISGSWWDNACWTGSAAPLSFTAGDADIGGGATLSVDFTATCSMTVIGAPISISCTCSATGDPSQIGTRINYDCDAMGTPCSGSLTKMN